MNNPVSAKHLELVTKLREIFQIDRPELDFGIYRILNARATEINDYLQNRLLEKVRIALGEGAQAQRGQVAQELQEKEAQYRADGMNPDDVPRVKELREKLALYSAGNNEHENSVFSHLLSFFSRYYDNGDFISQRRYKGDTYAIPYSGEEVMLHWANKGQYYTKSGENFSNYSFKLDDGRTVHFRLVAADTAKDNRKDNDKERRFDIVETKTVTRIDENGDEYEEKIQPVTEMEAPDGTKELVVRFEYVPQSKGSKQEVLVTKAVETVLQDSAVKARWLGLSKRIPTEKNPQRTLLEKHISVYTTKNTADYFVHKDLGGFLRRELDFFIKNEVMHLDDLQNTTSFNDIEKNLRLIQCLRSIGFELIGFLAQLEEFQKKLWLKKKFVVSSHYCITIDRVPDELLVEVVSNFKQWDQWRDLGFWNSEGNGTELDLKNNLGLIVDTSIYSKYFQDKLIKVIDDLDEHINGLMINSDNFQALNLLWEKYNNKISVIYVDPPYNTSASEIFYKNSFKHSSWLTMMDNRTRLGKKLLSAEHGIQCTTIDDVEQKILGQLLEEVYEEIAGTVSIRIKPSGRPIPNGFALSHEYAIFTRSNSSISIKRLGHSEEQSARYREKDKKGNFFWEMFRKAGSNSNRENRPTMFYPFYVDSKLQVRLVKGIFNEDIQNFQMFEEPRKDEVIVYPIKDDGSEGRWYFGYERALSVEKEFKAERQNNGSIRIYYRRRPNDGVQPTSLWFDSKYSATEHGTALLKKLFGEQEVFSYPKSIFAVEDCLSVAGADKTDSIILDYFAGSGTTGHAVINFNRVDKGNRKFILVEQGEYFDAVTKPRIQKVIYCNEWAEGRPISNDSFISQCIKVVKLESYEDCLNNLQLNRTAVQGDLLNSLAVDAKDDYLLNYMLDVESRGSLLSVEDFKKPFDYKLNIAVDSAGAFEPKKVDLVETFNYLIGLRIKHIDAQPQRGFVTVTGTLPSGESCLVLWRDCEKIDYDELRRMANRLDIEAANNPYAVIYINGDHNIPASYTPAEGEEAIGWAHKIRPIEPEFLERMFSVEDI